ncbi:hypothetical protein ACFE04_007669 [Oxalis oulophora]
MAVNASTPTTSRIRPTTPAPLITAKSATFSSSTSSTSTFKYFTKPTSSSSFSSRTSLSSLRESLSENPHIYDISELRSATNNFLSRSSSSSSSYSSPSWRCNLRGKDSIIFQRKLMAKLQTTQLKERLLSICRTNNMSIAKLLGVSTFNTSIYLVYEFVQGASLQDCLRNSKNTNFTVLCSWMSRMQIAADIAHGLDYVHHNSGLNVSLVHKHIKSSAIIVTEPSFNAKLCHFGTAQLCGEVDSSDEEEELSRSAKGISQFQGVRGYMSPEFLATGVATQKSDVYAFGVVMLELLSGEEPLKYKLESKKGDFVRTSIIDAARDVVDGGDEGRLRRWIDRRLKDSFPVDVAVKMTVLALDCLHVDKDRRPEMGRVAGKISKLYLESKNWFDNIIMPTDITVSFAPR